MDAVILCGGRGTRLASVVSDVPKPMAEVLGRPFLDYVFDYLIETRRITRLVLATGHLSEKIESHYGERYGGLPIVYSQEAAPLGTGGAVLHALRQITPTEPFLLLNGDSFVNADLDGMLALHTRLAADVTMAVYQVDDAARFGQVSMQGEKLSGFLEKSGVSAPGLINSGIYLLRPLALAPWADHVGAVSLETVILPHMIAGGKSAGLVTGTRFIDIGLPETYHAAGQFFS